MGKHIMVRNIWKAILVAALVLAAALWSTAIFVTDWVASASSKALLALQGTEVFTLAVCAFCIYQLLQGQKYRALLSAALGSACAMLGIVLRFLLVHQSSLRMAFFDLGGVALGLVVAMLQPNVNTFLKVHIFEGLNRNTNKRKKLENLLDVLSLAAAFAYIGYCFLGSTTFPLIYNNTMRYFVAALIICGGLRFLYYFLREAWSLEDETVRLKLIGKTALAFCVAIPFVLSGVVSERDSLIILPLLMLCVWRMHPERVLRSYTLVVGVLLAATVLCCLAGCIQNISTTKGKSSYGIVNTTDFAAYFIFLLLCIWCTQRVRTWYTALFMVALSLATAACTYYYAGSRTTVICCALVAFACAWDWLATMFSGKIKFVSGCIKIVNFLCIGAFPITAITLTCITYAYGKGIPWAMRLDELLSYRIKPLWEVYNKQGIHLLGKVFKMHGQGSTVLGPGAAYDFLDSGYAYLLIRNGILVFIAMACLWVWMSLRAARGNRRRLVLAMAIVAFYGFSECQMININYNIFLAMPFCAFSAPQECEKADQLVAKRWLISLAVGVLLGMIIYMLTPTIISWLKSTFYLLGWTYSYRTKWALLLIVTVIACYLLIWKTTSLTVQRAASVHKIALVTSLLFLSVGVLWTNSVIQSGLESHGAELDAEQDTIRLIQSSSTQPVYAAEKSELYQRKIGGIEDYVLTVDDLSRFRKGTIMVDKAHDSIRLTASGASYIQFSETSGLYTYDSAVVKTLEGLGKKALRYNNSEQLVDMEDLAQLNKLMQDEHGGLKLSGPEHSLNENRAVDQLAGSYEVRLVLHAEPNSLKKLGKREICAFRARINRDEVLVCEKIITANEFDEAGELSATIPYTSKAHMPRLQYTITVADGITVFIDKMSWTHVA